MPVYEYRCVECEARFEVRRPAAEYDAAAPPCPHGHAASRRVLSVFATVGRSGAEPAGPPPGGGCGPGCACAANA